MKNKISIVILTIIVSTSSALANCRKEAKNFALSTAKRISQTNSCKISSIVYGLNPKKWDESTCESGECYDISVSCAGIKGGFEYPIEATTQGGKCSVDFTQ